MSIKKLLKSLFMGLTTQEFQNGLLYFGSLSFYLMLLFFCMGWEFQSFFSDFKILFAISYVCGVREYYSRKD